MNSFTLNPLISYHLTAILVYLVLFEFENTICNLLLLLRKHLNTFFAMIPEMWLLKMCDKDMCQPTMKAEYLWFNQ